MPDRETFRQLCRRHGCRCTNQRLAVYEYIYNCTEHPDVDRIWRTVRKKMPAITRESVFRILMELADWHVITRMDTIVNARFDGVPQNHGHMICRDCGRIIDFELPPDVPVPAEANGFRADHVELRVSGICAECARKKAADASV